MTTVFGRERSFLRLVAGKSFYVTLGYSLVVLAVVVSMTVLLGFRSAIRTSLSRAVGMVPDAQFVLAQPVPVATAVAAAAVVSGRHPGIRLSPMIEVERDLVVRWDDTSRPGRGGASPLAVGVKRRVRILAVRVPSREVALQAITPAGDVAFLAREVRPDYIVPSRSGFFGGQTEIRLRDPDTGLVAGPYLYDPEDGTLYAVTDDDLQRSSVLALVSAVVNRSAPVGTNGAFVSAAPAGDESAGPASEDWKLHKLIYGPIDTGDPVPAYLSGQLFDAFFESGFDYRTLKLEADGLDLLDCEVVGHFQADLPASWNGNVIVMRHDASTEPVHRNLAGGLFLMSQDRDAVAVAERELRGEGLPVDRVITGAQFSAAVTERLRKAESVFWLLAALLLLVAVSAAVTLLQRLGVMCRDELFLIRLYGGNARYALALFGAVAAASSGAAGGIVVVALHARLNTILSTYYYPRMPFPLWLYAGVALLCITLFSAGTVLSAGRPGEAGSRG